MGCFAVTCVLSGLSIYSQEAVYIPLMPGKYTKLDDKKQVPFKVTDNFVSNDGAFGMFVPKYLPIFGSCDTYGRLEDIVKGQTSEISSPYLTEMYNKYEQQYGCFVDRTMWDWAVETSRKDISVYNNYAVGKYVEKYADTLGFVFEETDNSLERYNKIFYHKSNPNYKLYSDGTWIEGGVYNFDELISLLNRNGITLPNLDFLKSISPIELDITEAIIKHRNRNQDRFYMDGMQEFRNNVGHLFSVYESVDVDILAKELSDLLHFAYVMYLCNRMFIPQMSGTQTGAYDVQKQMYAKAIEVCDSIIGMYDDGDEDD